MRTSDVNIPVNVGGMRIETGTLLHGDRNGVTTIPLDIAGPVARACNAFMQAEEAMIGYVRGNESCTIEGLNHAHEQTKKLTNELADRIRRGDNP